MAVDASGVAYVTDMNNHRVRLINISTGAVTTLAGSGAAASTDGAGTAAAFWGPHHLALDGIGNLYVAESTGHRIRKVALATRAVSTVAGTGVAAFADGVGVAAAFSSPRGIACDAIGNAYVADGGNNRIRKIVLSSATVTTLAGSAANASGVDGVGAAAGFTSLANLVVDSSGAVLFVADGSKVRQIEIATQTVTTLAGSATAGAGDGVGAAAQFRSLHGLTLDTRGGNLFVSDVVSHNVRQIVIATQAVTTIAGSGAVARVDGLGTSAAFNNPSGLAIDARGNMLVADSSSHRVRVLQPTVPCPAGMYCAAGATAPVSCTPGFYCASGSDRMPCAVGFYCPVGSSRQVACPAGAFHCPLNASAPVSIACAAGYVWLRTLLVALSCRSLVLQRGDHFF